MEKVVICMKWGSLYSGDYVNVLFHACQRHLTGPFKFVCLTDDPSGIVEAVETHPIAEIGCSPQMWRHGAWPKLSVFAADLFGLSGRALFIDMDTVICGSLDRFFDHPAPFIAINTGKNWRPGSDGGTSNPLVGTGVFAFNIGEQTQILARFQENPQAAFEECDLEQVWVQNHASSLDYWPLDWVISFKKWLRQPLGLDLIRPPKAPPPDAGMVAFHGDPRPIELIRTGNRRWDEFPHLGRGQVPWMRDYWVENGGTVPGAED